MYTYNLATEEKLYYNEDGDRLPIKFHYTISQRQKRMEDQKSDVQIYSMSERVNRPTP